jgi:hypothetical protein
MTTAYSSRRVTALALWFGALGVAGCGASGSSPGTGTVGNPVPPAGQTAISGSPPTAVAVNSPYAFTPAATSGSGQALAFTIQGKPAWATFSTASGALTGVPSTPGVFANIVISASDGSSSASLPGFGITVASGTGIATLAWSEPTQNEDGSALTDLTGYHIYVGADASHLVNQVNIATTATTSYSISGLVGGATYYFAVTAVNSLGQESVLSNVASQVI